MGIQTRRFIAASSIPSLFLCKICHGVAEDPRQSPCCHELFCKDCVKTLPCYNCPHCAEVCVLTPPSDNILNQMNKLLVICENHDLGCRDIIRFGDLSSHMCTAIGESANSRSRPHLDESDYNSLDIFCDLNTLSAQKSSISNVLSTSTVTSASQSTTTMNLASPIRQSIQPSSLQQIQDIQSKKSSTKRVRDETSRELDLIEKELLRVQQKLKQSPTHSVLLCDEAEIVDSSPLVLKPAERQNSINHVDDSPTISEFDKYLPRPPLSTAWRFLPAMPGPRYGASAVSRGQDIFVIGGIDNTGTSSSVMRFDTSSWQWQTTIPPLSVPRAWCATVTGLDRLFVFGGCNGVGQTHQSAEMYDLTTETWCPLPDMLYARESCCAVMVRNRIFVFGGVNQTEVLDSVEVFDLETLKWTLAPSMTRRRGACAAVYCELMNQIFVIGGTDGRSCLSSVEIFDLSTYTWTISAPLLQPRIGCSAVCVDGNIIVAGGGNSDEYLSSVEAFTAQGKRKSLPSMLNPRLGCSAVVCDGSMVVVGGRDNKSNPLWTMETFRL